jgi:hypothetical protein
LLTIAQQNLEDFARSIDPKTPARLAFTISVKDFLQNSSNSAEEFWNPISVAIVSDFPQDVGTKERRLVQGAVNIRKTIGEIRDPAYKIDYARLMEHAPKRQGQYQGMGGKLPATLMLTSWSHAPFSSLQTWSDSGHETEPVLVQPALHCLEVVPIPRGQDRQCGICWRGKDGGYWLTANLQDELWSKILYAGCDG